MTFVWLALTRKEVELTKKISFTVVISGVHYNPVTKGRQALTSNVRFFGRFFRKYHNSYGPKKRGGASPCMY